MRTPLAALCGLVLLSCCTFADEAPPIAEPKKDLVVEIEVTDTEAPRLIVPEKLLGQLRAEAKSRVMLDRTQTIVAGIAMSLALALGGLWMARRNARGIKTAAAVIAPALLLALFYSTLHADKAAPATDDLRVGGLGNIKIVTVKDGDVIKLQLSRAQLVNTHKKADVK
jgi:hypothetical protein